MDILSLEGRVNRGQYLLWILTISVVVGVLSVVFEEALDGDALVNSSVVMITIGLIGIVPVVRRLHDLNLSGWWWLVGQIPLIGFFFALVLLFTRGTKGSNDYGEDPRFKFESIKKPAFIDGVGQKIQASAGRSRTEKPIEVTRSDSDVFFQKSMEELEEDRVDKALWASIFSQTGGDENKAKALYIKTRAKELLADSVEEAEAFLERLKKHVAEKDWGIALKEGEAFLARTSFSGGEGQLLQEKIQQNVIQARLAPLKAEKLEKDITDILSTDGELTLDSNEKLLGLLFELNNFKELTEGLKSLHKGVAEKVLVAKEKKEKMVKKEARGLEAVLSHQEMLSKLPNLLQN